MVHEEYTGKPSNLFTFFLFFRIGTFKMSTYKLSYFNIRARGEVARLLFIKSGTEFQEDRINYFTDEWPEFKAKTSKHKISKLSLSRADKMTFWKNYFLLGERDIRVYMIWYIV